MTFLSAPSVSVPGIIKRNFSGQYSTAVYSADKPCDVYRRRKKNANCNIHANAHARARGQMTKGLRVSHPAVVVDRSREPIRGS